MNAQVIVLLDACIIINLCHIEQLGLLDELDGFKFLTTRHVVEEEIIYSEQKAVLEDCTTKKILEVELITEYKTIRMIDELARSLGKGEASCIALAHERGWMFGSDDSKARQKAQKILGKERTINTPGIILEALRQELITVNEADSMKRILGKHRFYMPFDSFRDFLKDFQGKM